MFVSTNLTPKHMLDTFPLAACGLGMKRHSEMLCHVIWPTIIVGLPPLLRIASLLPSAAGWWSTPTIRSSKRPGPCGCASFRPSSSMPTLPGFCPIPKVGLLVCAEAENLYLSCSGVIVFGSQHDPDVSSLLSFGFKMTHLRPLKQLLCPRLPRSLVSMVPSNC